MAFTTVANLKMSLMVPVGLFMMKIELLALTKASVTLTRRLLESISRASQRTLTMVLTSTGKTGDPTLI